MHQMLLPRLVTGTAHWVHISVLAAGTSIFAYSCFYNLFSYSCWDNLFMTVTQTRFVCLGYDCYYVLVISIERVMPRLVSCSVLKNLVIAVF